MTHSVQAVLRKLQNSDDSARAALRALLSLQTVTEQDAQKTLFVNGAGFSAAVRISSGEWIDHERDTRKLLKIREWTITNRQKVARLCARYRRQLVAYANAPAEIREVPSLLREYVGAFKLTAQYDEESATWKRNAAKAAVANMERLTAKDMPVPIQEAVNVAVEKARSAARIEAARAALERLTPAERRSILRKAG